MKREQDFQPQNSTQITLEEPNPNKENQESKICITSMKSNVTIIRSTKKGFKQKKKLQSDCEVRELQNKPFHKYTEHTKR